MLVLSSRERSANCGRLVLMDLFCCAVNRQQARQLTRGSGPSVTYISPSASSDWARATLSYARIKARQRGSVSFDHSSAYHQTNIALVKVIDAKAFGRDHLAKQVALRWFEATCPLQPFPDNQNWKVLKKLLAASLFGAPEGRFFLPLGIWKRSQATSARSTIQDELPDSRLSRMTFPAMLAARSLRRAAQTTTYCRFCAR